MTKFRQLIRFGDRGRDVIAVKRAGRKMKVPGSKRINLSNRAGHAFIEMLDAVSAKHDLKKDHTYGPKLHEIFAPRFDAWGRRLYNTAKMRKHKPDIDHWVVMAPGADRPGMSTKAVVKAFVGKTARIFGAPLTIGTGTNHNRLTTSGNVSDHWSGNAADIPAYGRRLIQIGQAALIAAGYPVWRARLCFGGLYNVGNHQIIFNTHIGGNHTNHCHVSAH